VQGVMTARHALNASGMAISESCGRVAGSVCWQTVSKESFLAQPRVLTLLHSSPVTTDARGAAGGR
jgi:hypothetical protein